MSEEKIPTQTQEQIDEFLKSDNKNKEKWIYSLRQSDDEEEFIDLFDNAGSIIIKRFIFKGDDMLSEEIHVKGGALLDTVKSFFLKAKQQIEAMYNE